MLEFLLPPLLACLVWWGGTGAVMLLDRLPRAQLRWTLALATAVLGVALAGIADLSVRTDEAAAYGAFACAVLAWAWQEFAFLSGWITGPRRQACDAAGGRRRLGQAVQVVLWHELALLAMLGGLAWMLHEAPNRLALHTFAVLWLMRLSAKLNLFLGVRQLGSEFLPERLVYLQSYFRQRSGNALMPVSLLGGGALAAWLIVQAVESEGGALAAGLLLGTLTTLAVVEHLWMVLPWSPAVLWRWALRQPRVPEQEAVVP